MINDLQAVTVFAAASCANVAVGFDILGFALKGLGDEVRLEKSLDSGLKIVAVSGLESIPQEVEKNTATIAMQAMLDYLGLEQGFKVYIKKNIPLSAGLGGSAASSVAAVVALNQFLRKPLTKEQLLEFSLISEECISGARHGDNVVPCLYGGMTLIHSLLPVRIIQLPLMPLYIILLHPPIHLSTRDARKVLSPVISLADHVKQSANLATFISALYEKNIQRLGYSCVDILIEPMRAHLIPFFYEIQAAAFQAGALACSISGSGPTVFAFAKTKKQALLIKKSMALIFNQKDMAWDSMITTIATQGARVINEQ